MEEPAKFNYNSRKQHAGIIPWIFVKTILV